jgi:hypothetical protein
MVQVEKGLLLKCDKPLRQYLIHLNMSVADKFIITENAGEMHLFVTNAPGMKERLADWLTKWHDENSYAPPGEGIDDDEEDELI